MLGRARLTLARVIIPVEGSLSTLLVEQNLPFAIKVADYTHVLSKGTIVYSSTPSELWQNEEVKAQYLGI